MTGTALSSPRLLLDELSAAGWGDLTGSHYHGVRTVFRTLVDYQGADRTLIATAAQIADRAGLSVRHTRRCLHVLEALNLLTWTRGHIAEGRPRPGWFRVRLTALRQMVCHAREALRRRRRDRQAQTDHRIRTTVRNATLWPRKQRRNPLSLHADTESTLPPKGVRGAGPPAPARPPASPLPALTGDLSMQTECIHENPDINSCYICRQTLRDHPDMDVKKLWRSPVAPLTPQQRADAARAGREACRAAVRQSTEQQGPLL